MTELGPELDELLGREAVLGELRSRHRDLVRRRLELMSELGRSRGAASRPVSGRIDWGDLRRVDPLSRLWGLDRGQPVDRHYIELHLEEHAADVRGRVLEICDDGYTRRFGGDRVTRSEILDIDPANPRATIVADLRRADAVPTASFDCIILTQVLQLIFDLDAAVAECRRMLAAGGVLLATLPCVSKIALEQGPDGDRWRFTEEGARRLFAKAFPAAGLRVRSHGNVRVRVAFLLGLAAHEVPREVWGEHDPTAPLLVSVRAVAPGA